MMEQLDFRKAISGIVVLVSASSFSQGCLLSGDPSGDDDHGQTSAADAPIDRPEAAPANMEMTPQAVNACPGTYPGCSTCAPDSCGQPCCMHEREPGFEIWYEDDCSGYAHASWTPNVSQPPVLCDVDPDSHFGGVTIEIYGATAYQDTSCTHRPDAWQKALITTVHCSWWTALTDGSACGRKVQAKIAELAAQGYVPIIAEAGHDDCPQPRL